MTARPRPAEERGAALVIALLTVLLLSAVAIALVTVTTTETLLGAAHRHAQEAAYGAEAAFERALHDLAAVPDWSVVLAAPPLNVTSTFVDGRSTVVAPDGRSLNLSNLTTERQRQSDARDAGFGADSPEWRLYSHAALRELLPPDHITLPLYLVSWVADDGEDGDGDPQSDANNRVLVRAEAFGSGGGRRAIEAAVERSPNGAVRVSVWREMR
jgi:hypothetical protein